MKLITFPILKGTFTLRIIPTVMAILMLAVLIGLGCWQIQRLHWKTGLIAMMQERLEEPQIDVGLSVIPKEDIPNLDYHPGQATGTFDNAHELYLNAISVDGNGGLDVLTPLTLDDGRVLLVNRGWMPYSAKDQARAPVDRDTGVGDQGNYIWRPTGEVTVTGILRLPPGAKPVMRPDNNIGKNDWYWVDLQAMASAVSVKEFMPYYLEADDAPHNGAWPIGGQTRLDLPNHHLQYAITWFWLAFILPFIYFASSWKLDRPKKVEKEEQGEESPEKRV